MEIEDIFRGLMSDLPEVRGWLRGRAATAAPRRIAEAEEDEPAREGQAKRSRLVNKTRSDWISLVLEP